MKRNYKHTVAIDVDGLIFDFEGSFCDAFGHDNRHLYSPYQRYPKVDPDVITEFMNDPETYRTLLPMFGGIHLLVTAKNLGFYVLLLTSRPKHLAEVTREALEGYDVPYNEIWYSKNKAMAIDEYNQMYPSRPVKLLIDDSIDNLKDLPSGVVGMAWSMLWNQGYYPRATYDQWDMRLVVKTDTVSDWKEMWKIGDENE